MTLKKKRSFLDRLTGRDTFDDFEHSEFEELEPTEYDQEEIHPEIKSRGFFNNSNAVKETKSKSTKRVSVSSQQDDRSTWMDEHGDEGELSIDMYQTPESVIVRAMIPGVKKEDLDIILTRDSLTLKGKRVEEIKIADQNYFQRELYWGSFSRKIELPHEIDIDQAEAIEKAGMLTLVLPRIDKGKQAKLKVKSA